MLHSSTLGVAPQGDVALWWCYLQRWILLHLPTDVYPLLKEVSRGPWG